MPESVNLPAASPADDQPWLLAPLRRRAFLQYAGATTGAAALGLAGCHKTTETPSLDVGTGDAGALNFLYALEQVQTSFYGRVLRGSYFLSLSSTSAEYQILTDIVRHEQSHSDLLRALVGTLGVTPLRALTDTLASQVNFGDRTTVDGASLRGVLNTAQQLKDLSVAAYNGVARYFTSASYLGLAAKIASVEARHSALLRDLLLAGGTPGLGQGFVGPDVVDPTTRRERVLLPADVLARLNLYLDASSQVTAAGLT